MAFYKLAGRIRDYITKKSEWVLKVANRVLCLQMHILTK